MDAAHGPWLGSQARHYENFPVGSWLVPAPLRPAFRALYRFARYADDVADEGEASPAQRLAELRRLREAVLAEGDPTHPAVSPLLPWVSKHGLDRSLLTALLSAFEQDVRVTRYADFAQLRDYCRRSADPVGRLVLQLFGVREPEAFRRSDELCTALQLVNFVQDVGVDWPKGRLYLPLDDLAEAGLSAQDVGRAVASGRAPAALCAVIERQSRRARSLLDAGRPLIAQVPRRLGAELRLVTAGAERVLQRLERAGHDPIAHRPTLGMRDVPSLLVGWLRPVPRK